MPLSSTNVLQSCAPVGDSWLIMRNSMRVLEEVQTSLDSGLDELHTSLAATNERVDRLLGEVLAGQQQIMTSVVQMMHRVMRIDRCVRTSRFRPKVPFIAPQEHIRTAVNLQDSRL